MKVVLFCGGLGMRLREYSEAVPKPLVPVGNQPILWHLMKYYAHFGHKEFILCLGWQATAIKQYFLNYNECLSNDFTLSGGGRQVDLFRRDIDDWRITFVDTGLASSIGQRLKAVEQYVGDDETFLANYTDGLSDVALPELIDFHRGHDGIATFLAVKPVDTFHAVRFADNGLVTNIDWVSHTDSWINAGFFVLQREIFQHIRPGEDLVAEPFQRLIAQQKLHACKYNGFWTCMDTFKQKQALDDRAARGDTPWAVWQRGAGSASSATSESFVPLNGNGTSSDVHSSNAAAKNHSLSRLPR